MEILLTIAETASIWAAYLTLAPLLALAALAGAERRWPRAGLVERLTGRHSEDFLLSVAALAAVVTALAVIAARWLG